MTKSKAQKARKKLARRGLAPAASAGKKKKKRIRKRNGGGFQMVRGRGDYSVLQNGNLGEHIGQSVGGLVSTGLNKLWNVVSGGGAYRVRRNTLASGRPPMFQTKSGVDGSIEIAHTEFLVDLTTPGAAFTNSSTFQFNINPGLSKTFPFLSKLASNYEQYELLGMLVEFKSTSATALNSTNTALGVVVMTTDYDVLDVPFTTKQQMEAYMFTTSSKPAESMLHPIECAPRANVLNNLYIRTGAPPTGADLRFYDVGLLQIATSGMQAASTIGEIWVSYHVRLLKPKLPTPLGGNLLGLHAHEFALNTADTANPLGTGSASTTTRTFAGSTMNPLIDNDNIVLSDVGRFLVFVSYTSIGVITANASSVIGSNLSTVLFFNGAAAVGSFTATNALFAQVVDVHTPGSGGNNEYVFIGPTGMTLGSANVTVQQISSGLTIDLKQPFGKQGAVLDDLLQRLEKLEVSVPRGFLENGSITDDDWKCAGSTSSSSHFRKPGDLPGHPGVKEKKNTEPTSLSDSVVDLIAAKLRK